MATPKSEVAALLLVRADHPNPRFVRVVAAAAVVEKATPLAMVRFVFLTSQISVQSLKYPKSLVPAPIPRNPVFVCPSVRLKVPDDATCVERSVAKMPLLVSPNPMALRKSLAERGTLCCRH